MGEDQKIGELENSKAKLLVPRFHFEAEPKIAMGTVSFSVPSSPRSSLLKQAGKTNCLCSPTTHPGSFRCRYHRNNKASSPGLRRTSMSVGTKLSELGGKPTKSVLCSP